MKNILSKSLILVASFFLFGKNCRAQDIHFSQFFETPLLRNPALAGIFSGDFRVQAVYRNQWNSVTIPYQTTSLNAEYKLPVSHGGDFLTIGGEILYDKAGTVSLATTSVLPVLNYHKSLSAERNMYLSAGFSAGIVKEELTGQRSQPIASMEVGVMTPRFPTGKHFPKTPIHILMGALD